jgi:pimeloyl-ACP methyl ester carboxylesterase
MLGAMAVGWDKVEAGPPGAEHTALLLPGGMCSARSYAEVMAEPALAAVRLVAVTMPGHAGAPPPENFSPEEYARITADLAQDENADVVVGFSMGAMVAYEMVVSGAFSGPTVLLASSFSPPDEPAAFRALIRLGSVLGTLPAAAMKKGAAGMVNKAALPPDRKAVLTEDFARNDPRDMRLGLQAYLRWLKRDDDRARRLCEVGVPTWVVHAEKGDGGLTPHERDVLEACPHVQVVTLPGSVFFLPNEAPKTVAEVIAAAIAAI